MANKKIRIRLKAYEHRTLDTAAAKIVESATRTGAEVAGPIPLPTERSLYTIIRATHKYKDSREQFEMRTHKRLIDIINFTDRLVFFTFKTSYTKHSSHNTNYTSKTK